MCLHQLQDPDRVPCGYYVSHVDSGGDRFIRRTQAPVSYDDDTSTGDHSREAHDACADSPHRLADPAEQVDPPVARLPVVRRRLKGALDRWLRVEWPHPRAVVGGRTGRRAGSARQSNVRRESWRGARVRDERDGGQAGGSRVATDSELCHGVSVMPGSDGGDGRRWCLWVRRVNSRLCGQAHSPQHVSSSADVSTTLGTSDPSARFDFARPLTQLAADVRLGLSPRRIDNVDRLSGGTCERQGLDQLETATATAALRGAARIGALRGARGGTTWPS